MIEIFQYCDVRYKGDFQNTLLEVRSVLQLSLSLNINLLSIPLDTRLFQHSNNAQTLN